MPSFNSDHTVSYLIKKVAVMRRGDNSTVVYAAGAQTQDLPENQCFTRFLEACYTDATRS
jgi:hypothetical protein